ENRRVPQRVKQCCNIGNFFVRKRFPVLGHISLAMRAFFILEKIRIDKRLLGMSLEEN
ncbi:hypothetical protein MetfoDRAFT_1993, partial [Methanotorris formicicus Mc-S-70]